MIKIAIMMFFISNNLSANNFSIPHELKLGQKNELSYLDFAHEFKGCPENSICTQSIGEKFLNWDALLQRISSYKRSKKLIELKKFHKKVGLPFSFLITENNSKEIKAAYWNSHCSNHNMQNEEKILKGVEFLKEFKTNLPFIFDEVTIERKLKKISFKLPYETPPLLIKNNKIIFALDFDEIYFYMSSSKNGDLKIEDIAKTIISKALIYNQSTECPTTNFNASKFHVGQICKKIWNDDIQDTEIVSLTKSCF